MDKKLTAIVKALAKYHGEPYKNHAQEIYIEEGMHWCRYCKVVDRQLNHHVKHKKSCPTEYARELVKVAS
jgi:hypothetical protein